MRRGGNVGHEKALLLRGILFDLRLHGAERFDFPQPPGDRGRGSLARHRVGIVHLLQPALAEEIAKAGVIKEGRIKQRAGITIFVEHFEKALHRHMADGERIEVFGRIERSKGGKARVNRAGKVRKKVRENLHPVFVFGQQRLSFFAGPEKREVLVV